MNKRVIISLTGHMSESGEAEPEHMELITEGKYYRKGSNWFVTYRESEVTGMEGTTTTMKITDDGRITLMRFGTINAQLVFEKGKKHLTHYDTGYGAFTVGVVTDVLDVRLDETGGEIHVGYGIEIDHNRTGNNDFVLQIREVKQDV